MNVPKLRFKEFNDEWIESNFSKTFSFISNNSLSRNDLNYDNQTNIFNIHYGDILTKMNNIVDVSNFAFPSINTQYLEKYNKKDNFLCNGDIVIADTAEDYTAGKSIELQCIKNEKIISGLHTIPLRPITGFSKNYLGYYLNSSYFHNQLIPLITGIKVMSITKSNLENTYIRYPSKNEQEKIGTFLQLLDKKIELQSKKIEALKLYKKGQIEHDLKSNYPLVKLSDILIERKEYSEKGLEYPHVTLSKEGIFPKSERYNRDFLVKSEDKEYKITRKNDLCYNPANLKFGVICLNEFGSAIFSPIYVTFEIKNNILPQYIKYYVTRWNFINSVRKYEQGTVYERMSVSPEDFLRFNIKLPSKNEQIEFVRKIQLIDKKIFLEQQKIEILESLKKGLMQNMFV